MAMLAEPRRKQKLSVDPRGLNWANDDEKFGQKLMERMGWQKGRGLGAQEDGRVEHVKVTHKDDARGVGCSKASADDWIAHQDDFNSLLSQLNQSTNASDQETSLQSLEKMSKEAKGRVHYQKFTRGKDLSGAKQNDLNSIFGRRKSKSAPSTPQVQSEANSEEEETHSDVEGGLRTENSHGVTTISTGTSVNDYFMKKMAEMKAKAAGKSNNADDVEKANHAQDSGKPKHMKDSGEPKHVENSGKSNNQEDSGKSIREEDSEKPKHKKNSRKSNQSEKAGKPNQSEKVAKPNQSEKSAKPNQSEKFAKPNLIEKDDESSVLVVEKCTVDNDIALQMKALAGYGLGMNSEKSKSFREVRKVTERPATVTAAAADLPTKVTSDGDIADRLRALSGYGSSEQRRPASDSRTVRPSCHGNKASEVDGKAGKGETSGMLQQVDGKAGKGETSGMLQQVDGKAGKGEKPGMLQEVDGKVGKGEKSGMLQQVDGHLDNGDTEEETGGKKQTKKKKKKKSKTVEECAKSSTTGMKDWCLIPCDINDASAEQVKSVKRKAADGVQPDAVEVDSTEVVDEQDVNGNSKSKKKKKSKKFVEDCAKTANEVQPDDVEVDSMQVVDDQEENENAKSKKKKKSKKSVEDCAKEKCKFASDMKVVSGGSSDEKLKKKNGDSTQAVDEQEVNENSKSKKKKKSKKLVEECSKEECEVACDANVVSGCSSDEKLKKKHGKKMDKEQVLCEEVNIDCVENDTSKSSRSKQKRKQITEDDNEAQPKRRKKNSKKDKEDSSSSMDIEVKQVEQSGKSNKKKKSKSTSRESVDVIVEADEHQTETKDADPKQKAPIVQSDVPAKKTKKSQRRKKKAKATGVVCEISQSFPGANLDKIVGYGDGRPIGY